MTSENWARELLAWAAGFLEGEGSWIVYGGRNRIRLRIAATNTDPEPLKMLAEILGVGHVYGPRNPGNRTNTHELWEWIVDRKADVYAVSIALWPWMSQKRRAKMNVVIALFSEQ